MKNKKIGILGLSRTGISVYNAVIDDSAYVVAYDDYEASCANFLSYKPDANVKGIKDDIWKSLDFIVVSPGVPDSHPVFSLADRYNIAISSDISLFFQSNEESKFIGITGTNGKSTTTALLAHILKPYGYEVGGNIGKAVFDLPMNAKGYVLELSSFQLDLLGRELPQENRFENLDISILLNITPDHLDRYGTIDNYIASKEQILLHNGVKIIGIDSKPTAGIYDSLLKHKDANIIAISADSVLPNGVSCTNGKIYDNYFDNTAYVLGENKFLLGRHNHENIAACFVAACSLGVSTKDIMEKIASFSGLAHRMQFVGSKGKISFYNDSKATNISAALCSLGTLKNIYWLVGGIIKENDLSPLGSLLPNIKKAYVYGQSKMIFAEYLDGKLSYEICENMEEALNYAMNDAGADKDECNILLAPACASYDQFKNFEERGDKFINHAKRIIEA